MDPKTVLVLTPSLGGHYFGELIAGLTQEVADSDGRLVVVETRSASAPRDEVGAQRDFSIPIAWSHVDAAVAITTAVDAPYLRRLRAEDCPVVLSSALIEDFDAPTAKPDNHSGTVSAVEHLLGHGHTRIGFVGNLVQHDIRDRWNAYQETLIAHGFHYDASLVFAVPDNAETGGRIAAREILARAEPPTALMIATDRNALGVMSELAHAGVAIPADLAVVGFDNMEAGAFSVPSLTTANQRFDEVGAIAGRLALAAARGEAMDHGDVTSASVELIIRSSCGCTGNQREDERPRDNDAADDFSRELFDLLSATLVGGKDRSLSIGDEAVETAARAVEALLTAKGPVTESDIRELTTTIRGLAPHPDTLRRIIDAVAEYAARLPHSASRDITASRIDAALWKVQAGAYLRQVEATESAITEQYAVDVGLLDTATTDPRTLDWLVGTHIKAAALGLWENDQPSGVLNIVGTFGMSESVRDLVGGHATAQTFPPRALVDLVEPHHREICVVIPVRTSTHDWGLLAFVGAVDATSTRETYQHWASLLSAALESRRLQAEVHRRALYDALTGLPNRRLFLERLAAAIARMDRFDTPFAVVFLDLDCFKLINDTLGHQMGDRVLAAMGDRITRQVRTIDTGARFGGDEFAILLADTDAAGAQAVARRIQDSLEEPLDLDGNEVSVRASVGVALGSTAYSTGEEILRDADTAMYRAKAGGPGEIVFFDEETRAEAVHQHVLHAEIREALAGNQFEVHYQPIVDLASGRTDRFEALVRWRHPERGLLLPDEFLSAMEEAGLIVPLGRWVLDEVCRQLATWGPRVVNVAVNLSDQEFWHSGLLSTVLDSLTRHHLTPDRLTLEVTEGVLMRRPDAALAKMRHMHDAGLRFHLDDFGTGYSSLETLHQFPVDAFKIDRSFLTNLSSGRHTSELLTALVGLGRSLDLAVVAEGVETSEQLEFLKDIGCATGQGFLFMPAISREDARLMVEHDLSETLLRTSRDPHDL